MKSEDRAQLMKLAKDLARSGLKLEDHLVPVKSSKPKRKNGPKRRSI